MKIIKGLAVLVVTLSLGSCFDPPEFPVVPQIDYEDVVFKEGDKTDSLILTLKFKDGDGDLGIDAAAPEFNNAPFNNLTFFQTNDSDKANLIPINTSQQAIEHYNKQGQRVTENFQLLQIQNPAAGKLVFPRTRKQSGYGYLPTYPNCESYEWFRAAYYAIRADQKDVLDAVAAVDTLYGRLNGAKIATHFIIKDTLYLQVNKNHYNIDVDFMVKDPGNPNAVNGFVEYNWRKELCQQDQDGRFPILTDRTGPLEGELRYAMPTIGFKNIFTIKTLKLRVRIRDRALNESNTVFTKEFTL